jgi:hypothetical protein
LVSIVSEIGFFAGAEREFWVISAGLALRMGEIVLILLLRPKQKRRGCCHPRRSYLLRSLDRY